MAAGSAGAERVVPEVCRGAADVSRSARAPRSAFDAVPRASRQRQPHERRSHDGDVHQLASERCKQRGQAEARRRSGCIREESLQTSALCREYAVHLEDGPGELQRDIRRATLKLRLIFNPAAGRGRARRHVRQAEEHLRSLGAQVDTAPSTSPDDLTRLAAEGSRGGYDRVVICGGDGTLHRAVREYDFRTPLAVLPLGSGDDFAKVCGIPPKLEAACDVAVRGAIREVDVAQANGIRYLGVAGLGFDSEVAHFANENAKFLRGSLVYLYAILRVLPRFRPHRVRINDARSEEIMFATVGNSRQYGGGIRITPAAEIDDGELDICIVHRTSRFQLLKTLPLAYTGAHVKRSYVEVGRGREFHFESERSLDVYADGERVTSTPVTFGLAAGKLKFVVPAAASVR